jgi:type II secretory pathway pseudopilin PulG
VLRRRGTTLAELLLATTLASIVLATAVTSLLRQQRSATSLRVHSALTAQLRPASASVAAHLAEVSPSAGDLVPGEWRDTALQFRAPIATGMSCDAGAGLLTLAPESAGAVPLGGILSSPRAGDSLWVYSDSAASWSGRAIAGATSVRGACGSASDRATVRLTLQGTDTVASAAPVRITRQLRLVVYRAGSGEWHLGLREWSESARELTSPQPLAGPFLVSAPSGERTGFRYFDESGAELHVDRAGTAAARVRRVRLTLVAARRDGGTTHPDGAVSRDSTDVAFSPGHAP